MVTQFAGGKEESAPGARCGWRVRRFDAEEGWGVIVAPDVPGDCFVHVSNIEVSGYRELRAGQQVRFTYEDPGFLQDGCRFRVLRVWLET